MTRWKTANIYWRGVMIRQTARKVMCDGASMSGQWIGTGQNWNSVENTRRRATGMNHRPMEKNDPRRNEPHQNRAQKNQTRNTYGMITSLKRENSGEEWDFLCVCCCWKELLHKEKTPEKMPTRSTKPLHFTEQKCCASITIESRQAGKWGKCKAKRTEKKCWKQLLLRVVWLIHAKCCAQWTLWKQFVFFFCQTKNYFKWWLFVAKQRRWTSQAAG